MRRFTFVGRLGVGDTAPVALAQPDSVVVPIQFVGTYRRLDYGLGHALGVLKFNGLRPAETAVDLCLLSAMVNAADTRVSRARNAQNGWTREIDLVVPVSDPALWASQSAPLSQTLKFLTGDFWRVAFRARPAGFETLADAPDKLPLATFDDVCLFSGGLDSLVGAIDGISSGRRYLLVSHYWDGETSKAQKALLARLQQHFPKGGFKPLRVRLGFDKAHVQTGETENTQRGRSFVFFALAALAASTLQGSQRVVVPENGLIGLNVPLDPLRLGALSTRTTHPHYMALFNTLLRNVGLAVFLDNPYRHRTKGEMVAECQDLPFLRSVVPASMSCSSPAKARYRGLPPQHCGTCVPCLIRRASLLAGLGIADTTQYVVPSLTTRRLDTSMAEGEHVRSFALMVARLAAQPAAASALARIPGPLNDTPGEAAAYVDVFRRGIHEVGALLQNVRASPS